MITYIKGPITYKSPTHVVVEAGGVGYYIHISLHTYARIEGLEQVKILTHYHVKEDSHQLYGFADDEERSLFVRLISVSGVGPSTAQVMLSTMTPEEIRAAIIAENEAMLRRVKGIGQKTAKQIILDLKNVLVKEGGSAGGGEALSGQSAGGALREEALLALLSLQVNKVQAQKALNKVLQENPAVARVEDLVRLALQKLS